MSAAAHTPGPWRFVADGVEVPLDHIGPGYYGNPSIESAQGVFVAGCDEYLAFGPADRAERAANIRLLLSAPELLAALVACLPDLEHYAATHGPGPDKRLALAYAAIAKAT